MELGVWEYSEGLVLLLEIGWLGIPAFAGMTEGAWE